MPELSPRPFEQQPSPTPEAVAKPERPVVPERLPGGAVWPEPVPPPLAPVAVPTAAQPTALPQLTRQVESVLEDGLSEFYLSLTPRQQAEFKRRGEETAGKIAQLLRGVKVKVHEVLQLIRAWLMSIPGVNRYFAEQEAKLKADRLLKLH